MIQALNIINLILGLASIIVISSIVWRVEKLLDVSFKFFLVAVVIFTVGIVLDILKTEGVLPHYDADYAVQTLFIICLLLGVVEMRWLISTLEKKLPEKNLKGKQRKR